VLFHQHLDQVQIQGRVVGDDRQSLVENLNGFIQIPVFKCFDAVSVQGPGFEFLLETYRLVQQVFNFL